MKIRMLAAAEQTDAIELCAQVFRQFEPNDGQAFRTAVDNPEYLASLIFRGAFDEDRLIGVLASRSCRSHIALFFVDAAYQGRGIGAALLRNFLAKTPADTITVNSSSYAVPIYQHIGFVPIGAEQNEEGLTFTPMIFRRDRIQALALLEQTQTVMNSSGYAALQELEALSDQSGVLFPYLQQFVNMTQSSKYGLRVRGFRLFCRQAKWDYEDEMAKQIDTVLSVLHDEKPTAVRQALAALPAVIKLRPELHPAIRSAVLSIPITHYPETMQNLILQDIESLLTYF